MIDTPFYPAYGRTQNAAVNGAGALTGFPADADQMCFTNAGTQIVFVRVTRGDDSTSASVADFPVPPNTQIVNSKDSGPDWTRVAFFSLAAGSTIYITPGRGY